MGTFALAGGAGSATLARFASAFADALQAAGFDEAGDPASADLVLNVVAADRPKPFRRHNKGTYVAALHELPERPDDVLRATYPMLVRALANIVLLYVPGEGVWFTTMERGNYAVPATDGEAALAADAVARLVPLASARLVIDNEFRPDLERELWAGDEITEEIRRAGVRLGDFGLLPAPFPVEDYVDARDLRHIKRLYGIGGLSYGNLSARKDERRFWMSASGVDKTKLDVPARDILLVSGYDEAGRRIVLSVRPDVEPRRVSVDAIEHWMIYREHPGVGAILHVHAWMEGIAATDVNFPCGTEELALGVARLIAREPDPAHAVVGLRNHGITATGDSPAEILDRIEPRLLRQVPMS